MLVMNQNRPGSRKSISVDEDTTTLTDVHLLDDYITAKLGGRDITDFSEPFNIGFDLGGFQIYANTSTSIPALRTGTLNTDTKLGILLRVGVGIYGYGGAGGDGADITSSSACLIGSPGQPGGDAIYLDHPLTIRVMGEVGGGGGGGGGGANALDDSAGLGGSPGGGGGGGRSVEPTSGGSGGCGACTADPCDGPNYVVWCGPGQDGSTGYSAGAGAGGAAGDDENPTFGHAEGGAGSTGGSWGDAGPSGNAGVTGNICTGSSSSGGAGGYALKANGNAYRVYGAGPTYGTIG